VKPTLSCNDTKRDSVFHENLYRIPDSHSDTASTSETRAFVHRTVENALPQIHTERAKLSNKWQITGRQQMPFTKGIELTSAS